MGNITTTGLSRLSWPETVKQMAKWYCKNVKRYCQSAFFDCSELGYVGNKPGVIRADCSGFVSACLAKFGVYTYNPWGSTGHVTQSIDCRITGRGGVVFDVSQPAPSSGHLNIPPLGGKRGYMGSSFIINLMKLGGFTLMTNLKKSDWKAFDIIINPAHIEIFGGGSNTGSGGKAYTWGRAWASVDEKSPWTREQILSGFKGRDPHNHKAPPGSSMALESHLNYTHIYRYTGQSKTFPAKSARK